MTLNEAAPRRIRWKFEGPAVEDETGPVDDVVRVLVNLQKAVRRFAETSQGDQRGRKRGPLSRKLAQAITLRLVDVERGSFGAVLELPKVPAQPALWDVGEQALEKLIATLEDVARDKTFASVPATVLPEIRELTSGYGDGIHDVTFLGFADRDRTARFHVTEPVELAPSLALRSSRPTAMSGRLREVDFKDHSAELYDATGMMTRVRFSETQEHALQNVANRHVTMYGELEEGAEGARTTLTLDSVESLSAEPSAFWEHKSVDELILIEGVRPLTEETLAPATFWPADLDPQDFIAAIDEENRPSDEQR